MTTITITSSPERSAKRRRLDRAFLWLCLAATSVSVVALTVLVLRIAFQGSPYLTTQFLSGGASRFAEKAGFKAAILGSVWTLAVCIVVALPLGVGTAIFLEEFKPTRKIERRFHSVINLNIRNLAGVPSVVYGLLGLTLFARSFGLFGTPLQYADWERIETTSGQTHIGILQTVVPDAYKITAPELGEVVLESRYLTRLDTERSWATPVEIRGTLALDDSGKIVIESEALQAEMPAWLTESDISESEPFAPRPFTATVVKSTEAAHVLVSPTEPAVTIPMSQVRSIERDIDTIKVRTNYFTLTDGRKVKGQIRDIDGDRITVDDEVTGEPASFDRAQITDYRRSQMFQLGDEDSAFHVRLPLGASILAGGLTLMLVVLPIIIISAQESLKAIPNSLREAALAMGCTRWQMVSRVTLPAAVPGIMTGAILAMSRAIGEAAPILVIGGVVFVTFTPSNLMDTFAAMPLQIYSWTNLPDEEFHRVAAAGIIVLLAVLLVFNTTAVLIRQKLQKPLS